MAASALDFVPMGTNAENAACQTHRTPFPPLCGNRPTSLVGLLLRLLDRRAGYGCFSAKSLTISFYEFGPNARIVGRRNRAHWRAAPREAINVVDVADRARLEQLNAVYDLRVGGEPTGVQVQPPVL